VIEIAKIQQQVEQLDCNLHPQKILITSELYFDQMMRRQLFRSWTNTVRYFQTSNPALGRILCTDGVDEV
jgi:hypothetical protein